MKKTLYVWSCLHFHINVGSTKGGTHTRWLKRVKNPKGVGLRGWEVGIGGVESWWGENGDNCTWTTIKINTWNLKNR